MCHLTALINPVRNCSKISLSPAENVDGCVRDD